MSFTQALSTKQQSWVLAKRLLKYFTPYKLLITISLICMVIVALASGATAWLIQPALDDIFVNKKESALIIVPFIYFGLVLLKGVGRYGQNYCMNYSALKVLMLLRSQVFHKIIRLPLGFYEKSQTGMLMSHIINDVGMMQRALPNVVSIIRQFLTMFVLFLVVVYQNWQLALWVAIVMPITVLPLIYFSKAIRKYSRRGADINADLTNVLQESLSGVRVIKAFATEKETSEKFDAENQRMQKLAIKQFTVGEFASPVMELIGALAVGLIIWYGGGQVIAGTMTPGAFFSFIAALLMMYDPVKALNSTAIDFQNALTGAERVFALLDSTEFQPEKGGEVLFPDEFEELVFDNVNFTYSGNNEPALKNAHLVLKKGERIALVGESGAGKTTFAHLIPRFYELTSGNIFINGIDLKDYDIKSLRQHIALVSQDNFLFNTTVAANIGYGTENVTIEDLDTAAEAAYANSFITGLPQEYETVIGERGTRLSGGQKQRLTIARAIIKNAPLLILDEATSALDSESERIVQQALDNLMQNRTSIVIAHRLSTILNADKILVLNKGEIVASGTHEELLKSSPIYNKLYKKQGG